MFDDFRVCVNLQPIQNTYERGEKKKRSGCHFDNFQQIFHVFESLGRMTDPSLKWFFFQYRRYLEIYIYKL